MTQELEDISIVEVPVLVEPERFPTTADREIGEYNRQSKRWADRQPLVADNQHEIALAGHANTIAAREFALIAMDSASEAGDSAEAAAADARRLASLDALWLGALAADPATGRDGAALVAGNAYVNTATGYIRAYNGAAWVQGVSAVAGVTSLNGQIGDLALKTVGGQSVLGAGNIAFSTFEIGDARPTVSPPSADWLEANKIYLQSSYPELFAEVGLVSDGVVVAALTYSVAPRIVVGGGGVLIAAGSDVASVRRSTDGGATWSTIAVPTTQVWGAGAHGGGVFVLFASDGSAATTVAIISTDGGLTWQQKVVPSSRWSSAAYDSATDTFMAVGGSSATGAVSIDKGQSWQSVTLPSGFSSTSTPSIAAGGGVFLITLGGSGASTSCWTTSNKGATWVTRTFPASNYVRSSAYLKGRFVVLNMNTATGSISDDLGASWETVSLPMSMSWNALSVSDSVIVGVGQQPGSHFISSTDGRTWRLHAAPAAQTWLSVANDGVDFVASGIVTAGARIKTATYNRATQFFVPEPFVVIPPFKNWVKAK